VVRHEQLEVVTPDRKRESLAVHAVQDSGDAVSLCEAAVRLADDVTRVHGKHSGVGHGAHAPFTYTIRADRYLPVGWMDFV